MSGRHLLVLAALVVAIGIPSASHACLPPPPPPPPSQTAEESDAEFADRRDAWYAEIRRRESAEFEQQLAERQTTLWHEADRVVLARVERATSIWVRGSEGQRYRSPLVILQPLRWVKGSGTPYRIRINSVSDDSCNFGGVGDVLNGEPGDMFVIFLGAGRFDSLKVLDSFGRGRAVTEATRAVFEIDLAM